MTTRKSLFEQTSRIGTLSLVTMVATVAAAAPAPQASDGETLSEIVVTGSRIQRSDASSVGPLTTLTADDIAAAAPTSAGDLLQALPGVGVSLNSNGTQGTSFGVSSINLRYLGSAEGSGNRTLVLVDGHRWVNAVGGRGFRDFVDLNTIPLGIIDSIEVLKDGASAIYGADAIAGVVNIRTKRDLEGVEVNTRFGRSDRNDNESISGYFNWGDRVGAASWMVSMSYADTNPVRTDTRALTTRALAPLTAPPTSPRGCSRWPTRRPTSAPCSPRPGSPRSFAGCRPRGTDSTGACCITCNRSNTCASSSRSCTSLRPAMCRSRIRSVSMNAARR